MSLPRRGCTTQPRANGVPPWGINVTGGPTLKGLHNNAKTTGILSNPFRVDFGGNARPQGCRSRQPWALLSNPFGVKTEGIKLILMETHMPLETEFPDAPPTRSPAESPAASHASNAAAPPAIRMSEVQPRPLVWLWRYW